MRTHGPRHIPPLSRGIAGVVGPSAHFNVSWSHRSQASDLQEVALPAEMGGALGGVDHGGGPARGPTPFTSGPEKRG